MLGQNIELKKRKTDMTQEEKIIRGHDSGRRPFQVPEGYFENFTERMMARVAAESQETGAASRSRVIKLPLWRRTMRYAAAAAVIAAGVGGGWFYSMRTLPGDAPAQLTAQSELSEFYLTDDDLNAALDYELVDNEHIAYYLTEAY